MTPEFSRPIDAERVSDTAQSFPIEADATERRRLAGRFRLIELRQLRAAITLQRRAGVIHAEGTVDGDVVQACAVTGDSIPAKVTAPVHVRYVADPITSEADEIELSGDDCDTLAIEQGRIDIGELAAETLALALDPYPRSPQADTFLREQAEARTTGLGAFAALKDLKSKLEG